MGRVESLNEELDYPTEMKDVETTDKLYALLMTE